MFRSTLAVSLSLIAALSSPLHAQWDPNNGDWGKEVDRDIRVMTWNVGDTLTSTAVKADSFGNWNGMVRIIAALKPDVLILQECGDNSGNGTGAGVDTVAELETTIELMFHGGADPFRGGTVESYIQLFTGPSYDLPHIYVSEVSDAFNRNVIISRFPFVDLNGDGDPTINNFVLIPDAFQSGGNAGIRGQQYAEIDLPDADYAGDVVVGNSHLKSGGDSSDISDRQRASLNIAYFIDFFFNGAGTGVSDPNGAVIVPSATTTILDDNTPVIWGGDFNQSPGGSGPVENMTRAAVLGGTDGTDRDRSDSTFDGSFQPISFETSTQSSSKLDYLCWQDSVVELRRSFIFRSSGANMSADKLPAPVDTFPINALATSNISSDHRPVIGDFIFAAPEVDCDADFNGDGTASFPDVGLYLSAFSTGDPAADFNGDGINSFPDVGLYLAAFAAGCP